MSIDLTKDVLDRISVDYSLSRKKSVEHAVLYPDAAS